MRAFDVFTPTKIPTVTFVGGHLAEREARFRDALEQGGLLISMSGPSKSGKTVFVTNVLGNECVVFVTGAGVASANELWERVFHAIGTPLNTTTTTATGGGSKIGGSGELSGSAFVVSGKAAVNIERSTSDTSSTSQSGVISHLALLIKELAGTGLVLFIDDFHYIPRPLQEELARQIKDAIAAGVRVVCASVPYRSEDVLRANPDLRGRLVSIDFAYWDQATLQEIGTLGFQALNIDVDPLVIATFASESAGSPQLMQALCLNACLEAGYRESQQDGAVLPFEPSLMQVVCARTAHSVDYSGTVDRLREGPKTRGTDRKPYRLRDGTAGDVYTVLLQAIAKDPPTLHFQYNELLRRIRLVCEDDAPSGSSVTGSCQHIVLIANDGQVRDIAEWDADQDVLDIRDPYLLFFMRWGG